MRQIRNLMASGIALMMLAALPASAEQVVEGRKAVHMGETLVGPEGVNRRLRQARSMIPRGYKPAFGDGRLNPLRAAGTQTGWLKMERVWSNTVPRKLISP